MMNKAPTLRARYVEKHRQWVELLAPDVARRLGVPVADPVDPRAEALVGAALACLDTITAAWARSSGSRDAVQLWDEVVAAVRGR